MARLKIFEALRSGEPMRCGEKRVSPVELIKRFVRHLPGGIRGEDKKLCIIALLSIAQAGQPVKASPATMLTAGMDKCNSQRSYLKKDRTVSEAK